MVRHAVTLAGPGTGKTTDLISRTASLITEKEVDPQRILVLTFTRAAAAELKERLVEDDDIGETRLPLAVTLHSFSLMVLTSDAYRARLPMPLNILDSWEQKYFLVPALASHCNYTGPQRHKVVADKLREYEAGWNSLKYDHEDWIQDHDPFFHQQLEFLRSTYGYTLLGELPYKLRCYLRADPEALASYQYTHVLVDEYQDLNPCDQDIISHLASQGAEINAYGDDDQSIYSFREAAPAGILNFTDKYPASVKNVLDTCYRCPEPILNIAQSMILKTPVPREPKSIHAERSEPAYVKCLAFSVGGEEVAGITKIVHWLHEDRNVLWKDILVLVPSKRLGNLAATALGREDVPIDNWLKDRNPLDLDPIRRLYAVLRLLANPADSLAMWTWLRLHKGFGEASIQRLEELAMENGSTFGHVVDLIRQGSETISKRIDNLVASALDALQNAKEEWAAIEPVEWKDKVLDLVPGENREWAVPNLTALFDELEAETISIESIIGRLQTPDIKPPNTPIEDKVRLMTMHKAKGLKATAVIIPFMEDEVVFQWTNSVAEREEKRRLVYVSLTRATHYLFVSHSRRRDDTSAYTTDGRRATRRRLVFLDDAGLISENGSTWIRENCAR